MTDYRAYDRKHLASFEGGDCVEIQNKKSIAVWQPYFRGGGAEAVALWILEALQDEYSLTLYTLTNVDFSWLNKMYGTHLSSEQINVKTCLPELLTDIAYSAMSMNEIFKMAIVYLTIHKFKQDSLNYDVAFSAFNALDMGSSGIQYLHWVNVVEKLPEKAPFWYQLLMKWVDFSYNRLTQNLSIANSRFTADKVKEVYNIDAEVIFPPVVSEIDALPWHEKEDAFLCSGRLVKAKSPHRAIEILQAVREQGFDVKLHITGGGGGVYEKSYQDDLRKLVEQNSDWVFLHQNLPYADYLKIVSRCRYGLHVKPEPFGISVAEMLKAGMIPFVRSTGGQVEIVGAENSDLLFRKNKDAVSKIIRVLSDDTLRSNLSEILSQRKFLFSTEHFTKEIRGVVRDFIDTSVNLQKATL
jgi:glycosyltransferase involved in cell wall biosynthesis